MTEEPKKVKRIANYTLERSIGEGTFGKVKLGRHSVTGEKVAIKILEKDKICDVSDVERVAREIHILKLIRHPNIVQLYEIIETPKQLYLIMEYANGGELFDYIVSRTRLSEREACKFYQQIVAGVEYIHRLNVVHRDLKPENLLLDHNCQIKIVDFGLSNTYRSDELLKTACGSPCYAAPEMIAGKSYNGLLVDIWSSGVILFAMICGYLPFEDPNTSDLYKKILSGDYECPKFLSAEARDMLACILNTDPAQRYNIEKIRGHPWFNLVRQDRSPGILVGYEQIPLDHTIMGKMAEFGLSESYVQKCIEANKHNSDTTTYYLMLKKHLTEGGASPGDIGAHHFVPTPLVSKQANLEKILSFAPQPPAPKMPSEGKGFRHRRYGEVVPKARRTGSTWGSASVEQELSFIKMGSQGRRGRGHARKGSVPVVVANSKSPRGRALVSSLSPGARQHVVKPKSRKQSVNSSFNVDYSHARPPSGRSNISSRNSRPRSNLHVKGPVKQKDVSLNLKLNSSVSNSNRQSPKADSFLHWVKRELAT
jgi:5'-AMP-activated protein kinase catalytic alpha subunit